MTHYTLASLLLIWSCSGQAEPSHVYLTTELDISRLLNKKYKTIEYHGVTMTDLGLPRPYSHALDFLMEFPQGEVRFSARGLMGVGACSIHLEADRHTAPIDPRLVVDLVEDPALREKIYQNLDMPPIDFAYTRSFSVGRPCQLRPSPFHPGSDTAAVDRRV